MVVKYSTFTYFQTDKAMSLSFTRRYHHALSCFLSSGLDIHYQKFVYNETLTVFFPYISFYQFCVFDREYKLLQEKQAEEYALAMDINKQSPVELEHREKFHRSWTLFESVFEEDINAVVNDELLSCGAPAQVVFFIINGRLLPVDMLSKDELIENGNFDNLQRRIIMTALSARNPYYRILYCNNSIGFLIGEPFTDRVIERIFPVSDNWGLDFVFLCYVDEYLSLQDEDTIHYALDSIFQNSDTQDKNVWCLYTKNLLEGYYSRQTPSPRQKNGIQAMMAYFQENSKTKRDDGNEFLEAEQQDETISRSRVPYFDLGCTLEQLNSEYDRLVEGGYLARQTNRDAFLYYFGGSKESEDTGSPLSIPRDKLVWIGKNKILALFIDSLGIEEPWKTASHVFKDINIGALKSACSSYKKQKRIKRAEDLEMIRSTEAEIKSITL